VELVPQISELARTARKQGFRQMVNAGWESEPAVEFVQRAAPPSSGS